MFKLRDKDKLPWFKILIHSEYFEHNMNQESFLCLNLTDYVTIDFTPSSNMKLSYLLKQYQIEIPTYEIQNNSMCMKYSTGFKNGMFYQDVYSKRLENIKSNLSNEDLKFASRYDFFICDEDDNYFKKFQIENFENIQNIKKIIGIVFSNRNIFLYRDNVKINEGYYYLLRSKMYFPFLQQYWSLSVSLMKKRPKIIDFMQSLYSRMNFIIMSYEKSLYQIFLKTNNDTYDNTLYHFGYFVMLCTGAFDDIAWLIDEIYSLKLHRMNISLKKDKYLNRLKDKDKKLYEVISDKDVIDKIKAFYPIRDKLQHRDFLKGYTLQSNNLVTHMIYIDEYTADSLELKTRKNQNHRDQNIIEISVEPYVLIDKLLTNFNYIIDKILKEIDWVQLKKLLTDEEIRKYEENVKKFETGIAEFYNFNEEPMYI